MKNHVVTVGGTAHATSLYLKSNKNDNLAFFISNPTDYDRRHDLLRMAYRMTRKVGTDMVITTTLRDYADGFWKQYSSSTNEARAISWCSTMRFFTTSPASRNNSCQKSPTSGLTMGEGEGEGKGLTSSSVFSSGLASAGCSAIAKNPGGAKRVSEAATALRKSASLGFCTRSRSVSRKG